MEETVKKMNSGNLKEDVNNVNKCETVDIKNHAWTDSVSIFSPDKKSCGKLQRSQLPNKSFDDSPFLNFKHTKLRKMKSQSRLTNLKQPSGTVSREEGDVTILKYDKEFNKNQENGEVYLSSSVAKNSILESSQNESSKCQENCVRTCPVCWKKFENEINPMTHMKSCASKHNLTLRQLLDALDLQAKQIEERRTLGLPCVPSTVCAKKNVSRKSSRSSDGRDPDLQLGLALSASMRESEEQDLLVEQEIMMEAGLGEEVAGKQTTLLEKFGFTSTRPVLPSIHSRKPKLKGAPLLLMRSQEVRERLITEKVSIILTKKDTHNEEEQSKFLSSPNHNELSCAHLKSEFLSSLQNKDGGLWKRASASPQCNDSVTYYVEPLSHIITPSKSEIGSKLKHLSQVPCRLKTPERHSVEDAKCFDLKEDGNDNICEENSQQNAKDMPKNESGDVDMTLAAVHTKIIKGSCEFVHKLAMNWEHLLNCKSKSDLSIRVKERLEIPVHELVFFVRCPNILHDVVQEITCTGRSIKYLTWNISLKCALAFLEFIYSGLTHKIDEIKVCVCVHEILFLCRKYEVKELHTYLKPFAIKTGDVCTCKDSSNKRESVVLIASTHEEEKGSGFHNAVASNAFFLSESPNNCSTEHNLRMLDCKEKNGEILYISSSQSNDSNTHYKLCSSPDPFSESCDHVNGSPDMCKRRKSSPNTPENMDCLLELLNDENSRSKYNSNKSDDGEIKYCNSVNISENDCSVTEKRKNYGFCNKSDIKRICTDDRKLVRKSLQKLFLDKGKDITHTEGDNKDICALDVLHSQSGNDSNSGKFIKSRRISKTNTSLVDNDNSKIKVTVVERRENEREICTRGCSKEKLTPERKHMSISCREETERAMYCSLRVLQTPGRVHVSETFREETEETVYTSSSKIRATGSVHSAVTSKEVKHDMCSFSTEKQMPDKDHNSVTSRERSEHIFSKPILAAGENTPYICIEKLPCSENAEGEMCMDTLGDFCADYEYQNFQASYFPSAETFLHENHCKEKDTEGSLLEEKLCMAKCISEIGKTSVSSPVNMKRFPSEDTPVLSQKVSSVRNPTWCRVKSSSDISINSDSTSSFPILSKCFSQNSIHLKAPQESVTERSDHLTPLEQDEPDKKVDASLGMALGTPLTRIPRTPNTTMNSLKCLLDDSFTDELERNSLFSSNDLEALQCSTPMTTISRVSTKQMKDLLQEENCVTPMADYSEMDTPGLKNELQKYGLKPLKRKRAKQILRHIYEELHPLVPAQTDTHKVSNKESICDKPSTTSFGEGLVYDKAKTKSRAKPPPQKVENSTVNTARETDLPSENDSFPSTQESSSSSRCEFEISDDMIEEDMHAQSNESDLPTVVHNCIMNNTVVHHQVLLFEPICLDQLQDTLKAENYRFKLNSIMEYLDEQCISFRIAQNNKKKRRLKKEKSNK